MSEKLKDEILKLADSVFVDIKRVMDLNALETLRINVLGKKGKITNFLKELKNLDYDSRIEIGTTLNHLKNNLLKEIMLKFGFAQHPNEWWHFSYGDQLWAWKYKKPKALYGKI